ncbi:MAG: mechanosensitive ion channel protein MscS, partial [Planctomycetaceae bacterium]
ITDTLAAQPQKVVLTYDKVVPVTLADVLLAVGVGLLTLAASKNIPGFMEMTVLQRLPWEPGGRYAFVTVLRYIILVVGVVIVFGMLGVSWSSVQWLAAAVTVGLGFGLQEIFANFVSGLILLFERPMRVGDIVTVGEVSGRVTRIHMRATTITDWDRKELIVPNKEFITGRLINWTLSDNTIRLTIPIGVAYGTDVEKVRKILIECATKCPMILQSPEPTAYFEGFGESSLNFNVRMFLPSVDNMLNVKNAVCTAIDETFKQEGIEIPFPQRDIHIRSGKLDSHEK